MIDTAVLRNIPLFREFEDAQLQQIAQTATVRNYHKHEFVVREGDPGGTFYIILDGSVAVTRIASDGRETILSILKGNDFFGEMSLFDSSLRSASIKTLTDVTVGVIEEREFLDMLDHTPKIGRYLVTALSQRLRAANQLIAATTSQDIRARLGFR